MKTFRYRGVSASVFENQSEQHGPFFKTSIVRTYKDGNEFKTTSSFSRDELSVVALIATQAWEFILEQEAARNSHDESE